MAVTASLQTPVQALSGIVQGLNQALAYYVALQNNLNSIVKKLQERNSILDIAAPDSSGALKIAQALQSNNVIQTTLQTALTRTQNLLQQLSAQGAAAAAKTQVSPARNVSVRGQHVLGELVGAMILAGEGDYE